MSPASQEVAEVGQEVTEATPLSAAQPAAEVILGQPRLSPSVATSPTAKKIIELLSEIGSNQMLDENFHPWFWDHSSGKLQTV